LSSAIASNLARGLDLEKSIAKAEAYIEKAMSLAVEIRGVKYLFPANGAPR
jgi:hydroxymethylpyrimidine/phosphomethylpyrimidine kinase